jgi:hypothetical protein
MSGPGADRFYIGTITTCGFNFNVEAHIFDDDTANVPWWVNRGGFPIQNCGLPKNGIGMTELTPWPWISMETLVTAIPNCACCTSLAPEAGYIIRFVRI